MAELASFHDVLFPLAVSFGATGGPERRIEIVQLTSGHEKRNARHALSRRRYDAGTGVRSIDDLAEVLDFFEARRGALHAFRFRDPFDRMSCRPGQAITAFDQPLGTGDGTRTRFGLVKVYGEGADAVTRPIRKPVADTLIVAVDGEAVADGWSFDDATGEIVFEEAPADEAAVSAGFTFDVPVRFDTERLTVSLTAFKAGQIPTVPLVEVHL